MPRPRNPNVSPPKIGGQAACNYSVRLPLDLALRIEDFLHAEMRKNLLSTGSRAEASVASLFRAALEHYLDCPHAQPVQPVRRGRPPKAKGAEVSAPKVPARATRKKK